MHNYKFWESSLNEYLILEYFSLGINISTVLLLIFCSKPVTKILQIVFQVVSLFLITQYGCSVYFVFKLKIPSILLVLIIFAPNIKTKIPSLICISVTSYQHLMQYAY